MYQSINIIPININELNEDQRSVVVDLAFTMNTSSNNLYNLLNIFSSSTTTLGIYKLIYKLEEVLITLNLINTIDSSIYNIREQSIGYKELLSIEQHSIRMFNNERSWITSYGSLGYYLSFITAKNASYLSPSEQSYYSNLCLIKLYNSYKDLEQYIQQEDELYDNIIYRYILEVINKTPEIATIIRHLKVLYKYDLTIYGAPYLLTNFKENQHLDIVFQTLPINYMYMLTDVYKAIQTNELTIDEIPLQETTIDPIKAIYDYNESLIGPGGIHTLITLLASTLIRRAHYLCNKDYVNSASRIEDLIAKASSLLQFSTLQVLQDVGQQINQITTQPLQIYANKL
jgi:hypothetical protein